MGVYEQTTDEQTMHEPITSGDTQEVTLTSPRLTTALQRRGRTITLSLIALLVGGGAVPVDALTPLAGIKRIEAGYSHTCALTADGGMKCWGSNQDDQLGIQGGPDWQPPVDVIGLDHGVAELSAGSAHTCGVTSSDGVKCWGLNVTGQVGNGYTGWVNMPADVIGLSSGIRSVAAGDRHTCAITTDGGVKCWGANESGQLGDNTTTQRLLPINLTTLNSGVRDLAAGSSFTCAVTLGGAVQCWGKNQMGQLGDGTTTQRSAPVGVVGLTAGATAIATGQMHACALTIGGQVKCWGANSSGQMGDGTTSSQRLTPVDPIGLGGGMISVAAGGSHTCALTTAGGVRCWGSNGYGQLGDGTSTDRWTPVDVKGLGSGVTAIAAGQNHTCALTAIGGVKCWGANNRGALGDRSLYGDIPFWTAITPLSSSVPIDVVTAVVGNVQGLWWSAPPYEEPGWGINFAHQGDIAKQGDVIFATWFTYDSVGEPWWLIAELHRSGHFVFSTSAISSFYGTVSTVTGPRFDSVPWSSSRIVEKPVGTMSLSLSTDDFGVLSYTVNGIAQSKAITRQVFGPLPGCAWGGEPNLSLATNYTDLWWNASESGWGINFSHQGDIVFATWFTYDASGKPWWLIAELHKGAGATYTGPVSTVSGQAFNTVPWSTNKIVETAVGTATVTFANGNSATLAYTVNGVSQSKAITRQVFAPPGTVCQ